MMMSLLHNSRGRHGGRPSIVENRPFSASSGGSGSVPTVLAGVLQDALKSQNPSPQFPVPVSSLQSPVSSLKSQVSSLKFPVSSLHPPPTTTVTNPNTLSPLVKPQPLIPANPKPLHPTQLFPLAPRHRHLHTGSPLCKCLVLDLPNKALKNYCTPR